MTLRTALHEHLSLFGYTLIETPIIESASLFLTKAGDRVIEQLLTFTRSGKEYALRPEFTASAVERYQTQQNNVVRWQFSGEIFQDSAARPGNFQSMSLGAECIGLDSVAVDAEIIAAAALGLERVGIHHYRVIIGHVGLTQYLLRRFNLDDRIVRFLLNQKHMLVKGQKKEVIHKLDAYLSVGGTRSSVAANDSDTVQAERVLEALLNSSERGIAMGNRTREDIARRLVSKSQRAAQRDAILAAVDWLEAWSQIDVGADDLPQALAPHCVDDPHAQHLLDELLHTLTLLRVYGINDAHVTVQPDLARTWDYYTGIVFELTTAKGIDLGGGGRYNELMRLLGGKNTPAVGFAYYLDNIAPLINLDTEQNMSVFTLSGDDVASVLWAQALRARGIAVALEMDNAQADATIDAQQRLVWQDTAYTLEQVEILTAQLRGT